MFTILSISELDELDLDELVSDELLSDELNSDKLVSDEVDLDRILVEAVRYFWSLFILIIYVLNLISLIKNFQDPLKKCPLSLS